MIVYIVLLIIVLFIMILYQYRIVSKKQSAVFISIALILVTGLRYEGPNTDYALYIDHYAEYKSNKVLSFDKIGLQVIAHLAKIIYDNPATWIFLMATLTIGFIVVSIYKYSDFWVQSILLYLFVGGFLGASNAVKQCAAIAIIVAFQNCLYEKHFIRWLFVCLVASLFHITAIIMIPFYFVVRAKFSYGNIFVMILLGVAVSASYISLSELVADFKDTTLTVNSYFNYQVNILRVLVHCVPFIISLFVKKDIIRETKTNILANFSCLTAVLAVASMNSAYVTRGVAYFSVFNIFFIPYLFSKIRPHSAKRIIMLLAFALYGIFWLYDAYTSGLRTYQWVFLQ